MEAFKYLWKGRPQLEGDYRYEEAERIESLFEDFEENEEVYFESSVMENDNYLAYRSVRKIVFITFFFIATPMFALLITNESRQVLIDDILNPDSQFRLYYIVNLFGILLYSFLHLMTWNQKTTGQLAITPSKLLVENHGIVTEYDLDDVQYVEISRGTTFHTDDPTLMTYTGDNHVVIKRRKQIKEVIEFRIEDRAHSDDLEELVKVMRLRLGNKFFFKSV